MKWKCGVCGNDDAVTEVTVYGIIVPLCGTCKKLWEARQKRLA